MERARITIFDTTLRDGEQSPGCSMNVEEKLRLARQLDRLGVDVIEAGFPISSEGDFQAVRAIAASVRRPVIAGLARAKHEDIERAWQALRHAARPRIHVFLATSDIHLHYKLRISREQCLQQAAEAIRFAKSLCNDVEFSPEDATRTDPDFLRQVVQAVVDAGATTVNIPDTVGFTTPEEFGALIQNLRQQVRGIENVTISAHCHNDLGMAVANSMAAIAAGARQVECTINGIGERAGNASLEEIAMLMRVRPERYPYETGIKTEQLYPTSQLLTEATNVTVQPNKAIIGRNAFAHEAGIHQDGVLKNPLTYEIMTPQSVGVPDSRLVLGKHSGRHALGLRIAVLGYELDRRELDEIYRSFVVLADKIKTVEDHHLLQLVRENQGTSVRIPPAHVENVPLSITASAVAGIGTSQRPAVIGFPLPIERKPAELPLHPMAEHHYEEDYLWGV
ncbi:MAG: 2-isopropylmalate synthase [Acidobacteria bacterium]|jgi:2-isopropylmalate synthase|nr:MAG: 2-isopropylmalate synthase [Acidobacteriota bacterium]